MFTISWLLFSVYLSWIYLCCVWQLSSKAGPKYSNLSVYYILHLRLLTSRFWEAQCRLHITQWSREEERDHMIRYNVIHSTQDIESLKSGRVKLKSGRVAFPTLCHLFDNNEKENMSDANRELKKSLINNRTIVLAVNMLLWKNSDWFMLARFNSRRFGNRLQATPYKYII